MKLDILDKENKVKGNKDLPKQFTEPLRKDLIRKAVSVLQKNSRQPYGTKPDAGKRASASLSRRRRKYRGSYGAGISRVPRKIMSRRGTRFNWVGAFAPGTVSGRRAHPPKASKEWGGKINKKENRKAIRSALSATVVKDLVAERGHKTPDTYPFILDSGVEGLEKTSAIKKVLQTLGLRDELRRGEEKKIRAGRGKSRGRKYKKKTSLLIVTADTCKLFDAGKNLGGVDIVKVNELNAELLAPGGEPGRMTLFTDKAIEKMEKEKLFV